MVTLMLFAGFTAAVCADLASQFTRKMNGLGMRPSAAGGIGIGASFSGISVNFIDAASAHHPVSDGRFNSSSHFSSLRPIDPISTSAQLQVLVKSVISTG